MTDHSQITEFDPKETGRRHAQALINLLAMEYPSTESFTVALGQVRRAFLEALDAVDPAQAVDVTRNNALPEVIQHRLTVESEQRSKERGSLQDPMYPPALPKQWD